MIKKENYDLLFEELRVYFPMLREARRTILDQDVSLYPVFIFHQQEIELGIEIADRHKVRGNWSVNASTLEEFVAKQVIEEDKLEDLKEKFTSPEDAYCLFVLSEMGAQFIFLPLTKAHAGGREN